MKQKKFNHVERVVETFYGDEYSAAELLRESQALEFAHGIGLGPKPIEFDFEEKRFVEEYFVGSAVVPKTWSAALLIIENQALTGLQTLMQSDVIDYIRSMEYCAPKVELINDFVECYKLNLEHHYRTYISTSTRRVMQLNRTIPMGLSHGDFKFDHIFLVKDEVKFIDWDTLGRRSIYFDYFNLIAPWLLHHKFEENTSFDVLRNINTISENISKDCTKKKIKISDVVFYIDVFLIERLTRVIEGKLQMSSKLESFKRQINANRNLLSLFN